MNPQPMREDMTREECAGDWCVRLASAHFSPAEQAQFDSWLAADPRNSKAFDRALDVWQGLHDVANTPEVIGMRVDALNALRSANRQRWSRKVAQGLQWPTALAASFALFLVVAVFAVIDRPTKYETAIGERQTIVLEDGSRMTLDAASSVLASFDSDRRELVLNTGRVKFDVAKDLHRPFTVTAGEQTVVATGTSFSVERLQNKLHVIVYEGHVAVISQKDPSDAELKRVVGQATPRVARLTPGKELVTPIEALGGQVVEADSARSLAWEAGQLNFDNEPLSSAVERLNRYEQQKIVLADERAAAIRVNGVFNAGDAESFVEALATTFPVRVRQERDRVIVSSRDL